MTRDCRQLLYLNLIIFPQRKETCPLDKPERGAMTPFREGRWKRLDHTVSSRVVPMGDGSVARRACHDPTGCKTPDGCGAVHEARTIIIPVCVCICDARTGGNRLKVVYHVPRGHPIIQYGTVARDARQCNTAR